MEDLMLVPRMLQVKDEFGVWIVTCPHCGKTILDGDYTFHLGSCPGNVFNKLLKEKKEREDEICRIVREELSKLLRSIE